MPLCQGLNMPESSYICKMSDKVTNTGTGVLNAFCLLIVLLTLLTFSTTYTGRNLIRNSAPQEIIITGNDAIICTATPVLSFQQTWILNKGSFRLLPFDQSQFTENKKTDLKITLLEQTRKNIINHPFSVPSFFQIPHEKDDPAVLS